MFGISAVSSCGVKKNVEHTPKNILKYAFTHKFNTYDTL